MNLGTFFNSLLFFGALSFSPLNAQYTWTHLTPSGTPPSPRGGCGGVFVQGENGTMYIFGGANGSGRLNDMFKLSLRAGQEQWTSIPQQGFWPSRRSRFIMALDTAGARILGYCGDESNYVISGDNWGFDLSTEHWSPVDTAQWFLSPSPRIGSNFAYDDRRNTLYLFGGTTYQVIQGNQAGWWLYDTWRLGCSTTTWQQISPFGNIPCPRQGGIGVLDRANDRFIFFSGQLLTTGFTNETWALGPLGGTHITLRQLSPSGTPPPPMRHPVAVYDSLRGSMIVFSGQTSNGLTNRTWELSLTLGSESWREIFPAGTPPPEMYFGTAVLDKPNGRMIVFGGGTNSGDINDVYALGGLWSGVNSPNPPSIPVETGLLSVRPNPSRGEFTFDYHLGKPSTVLLRIFDVTGRLIRNIGEESVSADSHQLVWDGKTEGARSSPSGVYFYELRAGEKTFGGKITKTK